MRSLLLITALVFGPLFAQSPPPEIRARQFLELLSNKDGEGAAAMLDPQFKATLPPAKLEQVWGSMNAQVGAFRQFGEARVEAGSVMDTVYITCEFEKMKLDARIPMTKAGLISGINFGIHTEYAPPPYVNPALFHEREVIVGNGEWAVHGTLTIPNGTGPFPAVVVIQGSGSYDRDYSIGPNKLFRDVAWGLASRGVAVIRYNKRPFEHATQFTRLASYTVNEEEVDDALLAAALLREQPEIDPKRVFLLGHSLGATLAPRIGKADPSLAGLIMVGAVARSVLDVIVPQMIHEYTMNGEMTAAQQRAIDAMKAQVARAKDPNLRPDAPAKDMPLGAAASYWLDLRAYRQLDVARDLKMPMLILQGGRDYQVTMEDFDLWKKLLGDRKDVEFKVYPKLNHIFVEGEGPSSDAEYGRPGHVSAAVIEDIAAYIKK